jgi:transitional endoplasmic reticulum ATPase
VIVIAATNRPEIIDPALLRSGRFDRLVLVSQSSKEGRENIFKIHTKNTPLADDVSISELAEMTEGYIGADIESVCREAVMLSLRDNFEADKVELKYFKEAIKKVRPTVTKEMVDYYEKIKEQFKGGMKKTETSSYTGYL